MEITIKTAEEFRDSHVTIQVRAVDVAEAGAVVQRLMRVEHLDGRLYTAAEVGDAQASEAELVSAPLRRKIVELEQMLADQRDRAEENRAWAERAENRVAALGVDLADARKTVNWQAEKLGGVYGALPPYVLDAITKDWTTWSQREAAAICNAIRAIWELVGGLCSPASDESTTSQA